MAGPFPTDMIDDFDSPQKSHASRNSGRSSQSLARPKPAFPATPSPLNSSKSRRRPWPPASERETPDGAFTRVCSSCGSPNRAGERGRGGVVKRRDFETWRWSSGVVQEKGLKETCYASRHLMHHQCFQAFNAPFREKARVRACQEGRDSSFLLQPGNTVRFVAAGSEDGPTETVHVFGNCRRATKARKKA